MSRSRPVPATETDRDGGDLADGYDLRWSRRRRCWERWTGRRYAEAAYSLFPERLGDPRPVSAAVPLSPPRREALVRKVRDDEVLTGGVLRAIDEVSVTVAKRRPVSHGLHFAGTVVTAGLWGFAWIAMALARHEDVVRFEVDPFGHVWRVERPLASRYNVRGR